jgi:hypothetical protein
MTTPPHRWLKPSLREIALLIALIAVALAWWRNAQESQRKYDEFKRQHEDEIFVGHLTLEGIGVLEANPTVPIAHCLRLDKELRVWIAITRQIDGAAQLPEPSPATQADQP